ncbi:MAG: matrixin family metalloprotease [Bryobacteraceae bacterium]
MPSYSESFYGTLVHEVGHAIGLQHTFTSGAMSTNTRATTKAKPITQDDIAAVSLL